MLAKETIDHCQRDEWSPTSWCPQKLKSSQLTKFNNKTFKSIEIMTSEFRARAPSISSSALLR